MVHRLNVSTREMAEGRMRKQYPEDDGRRRQLRIAALRLDAETMRIVFGWDPDREGTVTLDQIHPLRRGRCSGSAGASLG